MRKLLIVACAAMLCACGGNAQRKTAIQTVDMHTAENSIDYEGTYTGTLPAADCPGIETTLVLRADGLYELTQQYIERGEPFIETGKYAVRDNLLTLERGDAKSYYHIGENQLRMLDAEKQEVAGELAPYYILKRQVNE